MCGLEVGLLLLLLMLLLHLLQLVGIVDLLLLLLLLHMNGLTYVGVLKGHSARRHGMTQIVPVQ